MAITLALAFAIAAPDTKRPVPGFASTFRPTDTAGLSRHQPADVPILTSHTLPSPAVCINGCPAEVQVGVECDPAAH